MLKIQPDVMDNQKLDDIYKEILSNSDYSKTHDLNLLNEEGYNLLGLAWKHNHTQLVHILMDRKIDVTQVISRPVTLEFFDKLFKLLESDTLKDRAQVFRHLIYQGVLSHSPDFFSKFLEYFVPDIKKISLRDFITLEIKVDHQDELKAQYNQIWKNFKEKNSIKIPTSAILLYLLNEKKTDHVFSKSNQINKTKHRYYISVKNHIKHFYLNPESENFSPEEKLKAYKEMCYKNNKRGKKDWVQQRLTDYTYYSNSAHSSYKKRIANEKNLHIGMVLNSLRKTDSRYLKDKLFYKDFPEVIKVKNYLSPKEFKDFSELLKKYSLEAIAFPSQYSHNLVYEYLDKRLEILCNTFNVENSMLGANILKIHLKPAFQRQSGVNGSYLPKENLLTINTDQDSEIELSNNVPQYKRIQNDEKTKEFQRVLTHEYTHFLQYIGKNNLFNSPHIKEYWRTVLIEIKKNQNKDECIEFLVDTFKDSNSIVFADKAKILINNCFQNFSKNYKKDKKYIVANAQLSEFIEKLNKNNKKFSDACSLLIYAYHNQRKTSFQEEIWKKMDIDKALRNYMNNPNEVHARLVEEVFIKDKSERFNNFRYLNSLNPSLRVEIANKIKPKLEKFHEMLLSQAKMISSKNSYFKI